jgi:maltose alpha-D-glucosyltransferase/alpha-amylase
MRTVDAPQPADVHGGFLSLMHTLGERTAELHLALSQRTGNAAFDPEPMTARRRDRLARTCRRRSRPHARPAGRTPADLPHELQDEAKRLLARAAEVRARVAAFPLDGQTGVKTRFHGDYHLGQVLVSRNDFLIIDFEGRARPQLRRAAPAQFCAARRGRHGAFLQLRALVGAAPSGAECRRAPQAGARRARMGGRDARRLPGCLHGTHGQGGATQTAESATRLLALFEFEKAMYELRYELDNRLDWVQVPLQGILALIDRHGH